MQCITKELKLKLAVTNCRSDVHILLQVRWSLFVGQMLLYTDLHICRSDVYILQVIWSIFVGRMVINCPQPSASQPVIAAALGPLACPSRNARLRNCLNPTITLKFYRCKLDTQPLQRVALNMSQLRRTQAPRMS